MNRTDADSNDHTVVNSAITTGSVTKLEKGGAYAYFYVKTAANAPDTQMSNVMLLDSGFSGSTNDSSTIAVSVWLAP